MIARTTRRLALAALLGAAVVPASAPAAPPPNDDYLESQTVGDAAGRLVPGTPARVAIDTSEATVQADVFSSQGAGGGPEPTTCDGVPFGRTVWWDFTVPAPGFVSFNATGFDAVAALYEFGAPVPAITRLVGCSTTPEDVDAFAPRVEPGRRYTLQLGGTGAGPAAAGGPAQTTLEFFPDGDRDGRIDALDACPTLPGPGGAQCPPRLAVRLNSRKVFAAGRLFVASFTLRTPPRTRVAMRCRRGCSFSEVRRAGARTQELSFRDVAGRRLRVGTVLELRATRPGAIGAFLRLTVRAGSDRFARVDRCLPPGRSTPQRVCR
jgi:hypothetical protein